jgi:hypothetical protein
LRASPKGARFAAVANHVPHAKACVTVIESVSVKNQAFAQMPFLAMPELLAAAANFSGTQDLPHGTRRANEPQRFQ